MSSEAASIFRRGGQKGTARHGSLEEKLQELCDAWAEPRAGRDLPAALITPSVGLAEVVKQRGSLLNSMGFLKCGKLYLHMEEAVYLVDRGSLLLFQGGASGLALLSLKEAYELMVGSGVSMSRYQVYAHLKKNGYIVRRFPAMWRLSEQDDPLVLWRAWPDSHLLCSPGVGASQSEHQNMGGQEAVSKCGPTFDHNPIDECSPSNKVLEQGLQPSRENLLGTSYCTPSDSQASIHAISRTQNAQQPLELNKEAYPFPRISHTRSALHAGAAAQLVLAVQLFSASA